MGTRESEQRPKCQREDDDINRQQVLLQLQQLIAAIVLPLTITDLNVDCLAKCFGYLDLASSLAVSVASKWLRPIANAVYKRKFGTKPVQIKGQRLSLLHETDNCIYICKLKPSLQFLRCLGPTIDNLNLTVGSLNIGYLKFKDRKYDYIHQYISKYCAETLTSIAFENESNYPIKFSDKPFVNVQTVAAWKSNLGDQFGSFAKWFPNMRSLELRDVKMLKHEMTMPFQHLRELRININGGQGEVAKQIVAHTCHLSPQLQHLDIGHKAMSLSALVNIIAPNQYLDNLHVSKGERSMKMLPWHAERLVNEHPTLVELDLTGHIFAPHDALMVIQQLNLLKKFSFQLENAWEYENFVAEMGQLHDRWESSVQTGRLSYNNRVYFIVTLERQD